MPNGDWRKIGGILGLVLAPVVACFLIGDLSSVSDAFERDAADRSQVYAHQASDKVRQSCLRLPPQNQADCIEKTDQAARENQRVEQDLAAQRITAWWTNVMGVAALVGMALSAVGVFLVWTTFRESKRSADTAQNTYDAFIALERPRIILNVTSVAGDVHLGKRRVRVDIAATNIGKSSCVVKGIFWRWTDTMEFDPKGILTGPPRHIPINPAADATLGYIKIPEDEFPQTPFLVGHVSYTSPISDGHMARFCWRIFPNGSKDDPHNPKWIDYRRQGKWPADT